MDEPTVTIPVRVYEGTVKRMQQLQSVYDAAMAMYRHKHPIIHRPMSDGDDEAYQLIMQYFRACNKAGEVERG